MGRMDVKIAVVTGVGSGIGKAIAIMFAKEGAKVVGADFNPTEGQKTIDAINAAGVPASPINDLHQISHDPHVVEDRQMFIPVKHPVIGDMRVNGNPVKLLDMMPEVVTCAPALGQHNEEIYGQLLGLDKEQLETLAEDHVI